MNELGATTAPSGNHSNHLPDERRRSSFRAVSEQFQSDFIHFVIREGLLGNFKCEVIEPPSPPEFMIKIDGIKIDGV